MAKNGMTSKNSSMLVGESLLIVVLVSALVGAGSGLAADYLTGERHTGIPSQTRDFYVFTGVIPFNETIIGVPHDIFTPDRITVNLGDTVIIHYYNLEDVAEDHTFVLDSPFWTASLVTVQGAAWNGGNIIVHQNQRVNITFVASQAGVFRYWCAYHQPTMTGYLVVLLE